MAWLLCALLLASASGWAADDLLTIQMVEEARQWQMKDRDDLAAEIWRKLLRTNPKHPEALSRLAAIEGRSSATTLPSIKAKPDIAAKESPPNVQANRTLTESLGALDVVIRDRSKAAVRSTPTLESLQTASAIKNWSYSRRELEKLVQQNPGDQRYAMALARHLTYRESTRREGLRQLNEITSRGHGTAATQSAWRRALLSLRANPKDAEFFSAFLEKFPDEPAIRKRQRAIGGAPSKETVVRSVVPSPAPISIPLPVTASNNQNKASALLEAGRARLKVGDADSITRARVDLESAMMLDPANVQVKLELAGVYKSLALVDRAANLVDSVLASQPDHTEALHTRALLYAAETSWSNGLDLLERIPVYARTTEYAKSQRKIWVNAQVQRAMQLYSVGNFSQALALMAQAQEAALKDPELLALVAGGWSDVGQSTKSLALMRALMASNTVQPVAIRIKYAEVLLNAQEDAELLAVLNDLSTSGSLHADQQAQLNPIILGYTLRVTETLRESGRLAEASEVLNPALQRIDDARLLMAMARIYQSAGNLDGAMELVERVIVREPNDLSHRLMASDIALVGGDLDRAQAYAKFAMDLAPLHPRALTVMGRVEKARGNATGALEYFKQSQFQEGKKGEFPFASGKLAVRLISEMNASQKMQKDTNRSVATQRPGLLPIPELGARQKLPPQEPPRETPENEFQRGRAFLAEGDLLSAANSYSNVLKTNSVDPVALNNLGVVKVAAGEYLGAFQLFTQSSKIASNRAEIQENLFHMQAWLKAYTGVKPAVRGFDPYIAVPPELWPALLDATPTAPSAKPTSLKCKVKPCK